MLKNEIEILKMEREKLDRRMTELRRKNKRRLNVHLDAENYRKVAEVAKAESLSKSRVINKLIEKI